MIQTTAEIKNEIQELTTELFHLDPYNPNYKQLVNKLNSLKEELNKRKLYESHQNRIKTQ